MLNYIWAGLMLISIIAAFFTGRLDSVSVAAIDGAGEGAKLTLELCGVMCFWSGIMSIASEGGLIKLLSKLLRPITRRLFPNVPAEGKAMKAIVMNMTANILGRSLTC